MRTCLLTGSETRHTLGENAVRRNADDCSRIATRGGSGRLRRQPSVRRPDLLHQRLTLNCLQAGCAGIGPGPSQFRRPGVSAGPAPGCCTAGSSSTFPNFPAVTWISRGNSSSADDSSPSNRPYTAACSSLRNSTGTRSTYDPAASEPLPPDPVPLHLRPLIGSGTAPVGNRAGVGLPLGRGDLPERAAGLSGAVATRPTPLSASVLTRSSDCAAVCSAPRPPGSVCGAA